MRERGVCARVNDATRERRTRMMTGMRDREN